MTFCICLYFFFFKQKTAYEMRISDWSADVCSSDLHRAHRFHYLRNSTTTPRKFHERTCQDGEVAPGSDTRIIGGCAVTDIVAGQPIRRSAHCNLPARPDISIN